MRTIKMILFTITLIITAQTFAMEAPPAPPAVNAGNATALTLQDMPTEVTLRICAKLAENYNQKTVQDFTALASTNKHFRTLAYDPKNMRTILKSLRPAHAIDFAKKLDNLAIFNNSKSKNLLRGIKRSLIDGKILRESAKTAQLDIFTETIAAKNADINWPRRLRGETSLIKACKLGDQETFQLLLTHGASLNEQDANGNTALISAVSFGRTAMVSALLNAGANIYLCNNAGLAAHGMAQARGYLHLAQLIDMATHGAQIFAATQNNNGERVRSLLKHTHKNTSWRDSKGNTALIVAANLQNRALVDALLKAGARVNDTNVSGAAALAWAVFPEDEHVKPDIGIVSRLLLAGADPNQPDICGETPLFWAAIQGDPVAVQMLLHAGANQTLRNIEGKTVREVVLEEKNDDVIKVLDQATADGFLTHEYQDAQQSPQLFKKRKF